MTSTHVQCYVTRNFNSDIYTRSRVPVAGPNFYPYKLSDLKFTPLPSLHVDFYSRHVVNSVLFFLHNCPLLIPLHNTAVLIKICRF